LLGDILEKEHGENPFSARILSTRSILSNP